MHSRDIDFNAKAENHLEYTALHLACEAGHADIVRLLLENSEEKGINAFALDYWGRSPLARVYRSSPQRPQIQEFYNTYTHRLERPWLELLCENFAWVLLPIFAIVTIIVIFMVGFQMKSE